METSLQQIRQYDPNVIIQAADDKLTNDNDLAGGQMIFQSALLDWVDDAREQQHGMDPEQMREAIATLWLAYAHFLIKAKQFKSATEAYDQSVQCPIAGGVGRIWLDYARFAEEREKVRTAQNIYLRALVGTTVNNHEAASAAAVTDEQDRYMLWGEFLEMMRKHNDPNLTMEDLQTAVESEHAAAAESMELSLYEQPSPELPESVVSDNAFAAHETFIAPPPSKRAKLTADTTVNTIAATSISGVQPQPQIDTHVITAGAVEMEKAELMEMTQSGAMPPEITAAWMLRDGTDAASIPEPPLFSPSPPKLSDTSGRDILGDQLALALIQRLLEKSGSIVLHVCQGLWMLTAVKESESNRALERLDQNMTSDMERLEANLDARHSVAGAAAAAVAQMNERERASFLQGCHQQRQQLLQGIAWEFRQLLWQQQQILTKLKIPGFEGPTVDMATLELQASICSCLHSAFYLRTRVGQESHIKMLKSQEERFRRDLASSSSTSPKQGSRTPPNRSPMRRSTHTNAPTPPPIHYNMFPAPQAFHAAAPMQALPTQLIPQAMYNTNLASQQQQMAPTPYYNYMQQQQPQLPPVMPGAPPPYPNLGQYPPPQYY